MPGYLTNRYISLDVVNQLDELETDLADLDASLSARMTAAEENIEDLQLNIGV